MALLGAMGGGHSAEGPWVDMGGPGGASLGYRISPRVPFWGALEEGAFLRWGGSALGIPWSGEELGCLVVWRSP